MPLTREQTKYTASNDTVFLPSVAVDSTLGVRGNSVFNGTTTFNGSTVFNISPSFSALTVTNALANGTWTIKTVTPGLVSGERSSLSMYGTFFSYPIDTGPRRVADIIAGYSTGTWGTEYLAFGVGTGASNDAQNVTTERMRINGNGNLLIGLTSNTTDDSVYGLTIYKRLFVNFQSTDITPDPNWSGQLTMRGAGYFGGIALDSTGMWVGHNSTLRALLFATNNTERMRVASDGTITATGNFVQNINTTAKTANYQLTTADANTVVQMNGAFAFQVDTSLAVLPLGTTITLVAQTAGVTVATTANATVPTVNATPGLKLRAAWSTATLIKMSAASASGTASTWLLTGDLLA